MQNTRRLIDIMARLRDPRGGCPWDLKQTFASLIPYLIEEAYEVADAIERGDYDDLREELGDLLLQVVFHSQLAKEQGLFDFEGVVQRLNEKLIRRHPHVFGEAKPDMDAQGVVKAWEAIKQAERQEKAEEDEFDSVLTGIAKNLPALIQAEKIQSRAARHGFDWPEAAPVFKKVEEELAEVQEAFEAGNPAAIREEIGDLLFVAVNLARHLNVEPETALRQSNRKFTERFQTIEKQLAAQGRSLADCTLAELDALWDQAKGKAR